MKINKNKIIKKIRQKFIKKVTLLNMEIEKTSLRYDFSLKNFWKIREVKVLLTNGESLIELPCFLIKNRLVVNLPFDSFKQINDKYIIRLFINNEMMWIKSSPEYAKTGRCFIINNKYYTINIRKKIYIRSNFNEYDFTTQKVYLQNIKSNYNCLVGEFSLPIDGTDQFEVYAFNYNKMRKIESNYDKELNKLILSNFSILSSGIWQIFVKLNNCLYPVAIEDKEEMLRFDTFNHKVNAVKSNSNFSLNFDPHILETVISSIKMNSDYIDLQMDIKDLDTNLNYVFLINDVENGLESKHDMSYQNGWKVRIPKTKLYNLYSKKRFFILDNKIKPIKYQFKLDSLKKSRVFNDVFDSQVIRLSFYRRTDNSLGLKIKKPRIKRLITEVNDFKIKGYLTFLNQFINCEAYLCIEDRNSLDAIFIPIEEDFELDLRKLDLISLKPKSKTVMDFFIVIKNQDNKVIRKEKIKYKFSNYKKDNYYDYMKLEDDELNQHHFLVTTTPFNNVKIESFCIPKSVISNNFSIERDDNVWLIGERYNTAQDNGFVLYKWLRKNTNIEAYYVIESDSNDYKKIKNDPNVLEFGSEKHYEISFKAKVLMCTHDLENILPFKPAKGFFKYEDTFKVFLQHGVLGRKNVEYHKKYYETPFDLFIVSSDAEKENVVVDQLGYDKKEVIVTGLARFDNLVMRTKPKDILLMPTWRDWINTDEQFENSSYYMSYMSLIKNEKLIRLLNEYNVNLNFYPHYRAQNYFNKDIKNLNERINFITLGSISVQELLIQHALLITDYSSVSFDFTLMNKPVIYYHFDVRKFFRKGILRPIEETFIGRIATNEEELVELIEDRLKHELKNFEVNISNIIKYQDQSNCERIYRAIVSSLKSI